jgi:hypothetical protein
MGEGVAVDERDGPVEETDEAAEHAEHDAADEVALRGLILLRDAAGLAEHVDDGDDEGPEGDGPEAVGHGAAEGAGCGAPGHSAGFAAAEVPGAVDAGDGDVDGVFDPFGDPVAGEGDEDEETDDGCAGAAATAGWVGAGAATAVGGLEGNVDGYQCDREPCREGDCSNTADEADQENVAMMTCHVHCCLEHHNGERYAWDPADETDDGEDCKDSKYDSRTPEMLVEVVDCRSNRQCDIQDPRDPNELLCEMLCSQKVCPGEDESNREDKRE